MLRKWQQTGVTTARSQKNTDNIQSKGALPLLPTPPRAVNRKGRKVRATQGTALVKLPDGREFVEP